MPVCNFPRFPRLLYLHMGRGKTKRRSRAKTQLRVQNAFDQIDISVKPPAWQVRPRLDHERDNRVRRASRRHVSRTGYVRSPLTQL